MAQTIADKDPLDPLWEKAEEAARRCDMPGVLFVWRALAEKGVWQICASIGGLYENGAIGIDKDIQQALYWYRKAIFEGDSPEAHVGLGRIYCNASEVERNPAAACFHFERAYIQGSIDAALYLGILYLRGDGVKRDRSRAKMYLETAAVAEYFYAYGKLARIAFEERKFFKAIKLALKSFWLYKTISKKNPLDPRLLGV